VKGFGDYPEIVFGGKTFLNFGPWFVFRAVKKFPRIPPVAQPGVFPGDKMFLENSREKDLPLGGGQGFKNGGEKRRSLGGPL